MKFETKAIRIQSERTKREHSVPMYLTSSFVFDDAEHARALFAKEVEGNIYSRFSNPSVREFEEKMMALEDTEDAFATASGMSAVFASFMSQLQQGDHIIASRAVFGSTHQILTEVLPEYGITTTYVAATDTKGWQEAIQENTKMIFVESPSNPGLELVDLAYVGSIAKQHNLIFSVDNCFATPYIQNPKKFGANLVIHSATKYIDGQGRVLGGLVCGDQELLDKVRMFCRRTGPALSPFNAWVLSKSLETLHVRMDRHCQNANQLAESLEKKEEIEWVKYPFLHSHPQVELAKKQMTLGGGLITFEVKGGYERGKSFLDHLQLFSHTANLGDTRTIATHPASTTHSKLSEEDRLAVGITSGMIRISVGLEHIDDIKEDIEQALKRST